MKAGAGSTPARRCKIYRRPLSETPSSSPKVARKPLWSQKSLEFDHPGRPRTHVLDLGRVITLPNFNPPEISFARLLLLSLMSSKNHTALCPPQNHRSRLSETPRHSRCAGNRIGTLNFTREIVASPFALSPLLPRAKMPATTPMPPCVPDFSSTVSATSYSMRDTTSLE